MARGAKPGERRGGRTAGTPNKVTAEIREAAQEYTTDALQTLSSIMRSSESDAARVAAAREILDRAYGKSRQPTELSGPEGGPIPIQGDTERAVRLMALLKRVAA